MAHDRKLRKLIAEFMAATDVEKMDSLLVKIYSQAERDARIYRRSKNRILFENGFHVGFMSIFYRIADIFKRK